VVGQHRARGLGLQRQPVEKDAGELHQRGLGDVMKNEPREIPSILARMSKAPWTEEQVLNLLAWQKSDHVHPFTCPNRGDGKHHEFWGDLGVLVPSGDGWACPSCDYRQDWAHTFMLDGSALATQEDFVSVLLRGPGAP
jgi:hypothetical protein